MLDELILNSAGRFVTVKFYKKSGELRTLNGRMGVIKALRHPVGVGVNHLDKDAYITIWDMQKKGYRSIARDSIVSVSINHHTWRHDERLRNLS
jgi:hypothetical protein